MEGPVSDRYVTVVTGQYANPYPLGTANRVTVTDS